MKRFWIIAAVTFGTDQLLKYYVVHSLNLIELGAIDVLPPYLNLRMAWNHGINFGLFASYSATTRWILITIALAITAWVIWWMRQERGNAKAQIAGGLLVGGALGNVLDRFVYGAVADFLNVTCCGIRNPFAFNIADVAIFAGALGLVFFAGNRPADGKPTPTKR